MVSPLLLHAAYLGVLRVARDLLYWRAERAFLPLSGRCLSNDQLWLSFFHEAGHLVLQSAFSISGLTVMRPKVANPPGSFTYFTYDNFSTLFFAKPCALHLADGAKPVVNDKSYTRIGRPSP